MITEAVMLDVLNKSKGFPSFYKQLQGLMTAGGATNVSDITTIETLVAAIQKTPLLKEQFLRGADKVGA